MISNNYITYIKEAKQNNEEIFHSPFNNKSEKKEYLQKLSENIPITDRDTIIFINTHLNPWVAFVGDVFLQEW